MSRFRATAWPPVATALGIASASPIASDSYERVTGDAAGTTIADTLQIRHPVPNPLALSALILLVLRPPMRLRRP